MILNIKDKDEIRNVILEELDKISVLEENFKRIKLDKDLLEDLLFLKFKIDDNRYLKLPIWSGDFLKKLDLSEVDFEDVSYSVLYDIFMDKDTKELDDISRMVKNKIPDSKMKSMVYYGYTNANIDFRKSFEYKNYGIVKIHGFNFTGTDLSNNDIDSVFDIIYGYFNGTNIKISTIRDSSKAESSDFTGVDLSYYEIDSQTLLENRCPFYRCKLVNTGINITSVSKDGLEGLLNDFLYKFHDGDFDGCYINGVYIKSNEELMKNKDRLVRDHLREVNTLIEKVRKKIRN